LYNINLNIKTLSLSKQNVHFIYIECYANQNKASISVGYVWYCLLNIYKTNF